MAAGLTVAGGAAGALAALVLPAPGRPARRRSATPSSGSATAGRSAPGGWSPGSTARARTSRSSRSPPTSTRARRPVAEHSLPMPDVPGPDELPGAGARSPAATAQPADGCAGDRPGRRAAASWPTRSTAPPKRPPDTETRGWLRVAGRLPDDGGRARRGADVRQRPDPARRPGSPGVGGGWGADVVGASLDHAVWFHRRSAPTSGSSTRPTARPPPAAGRCASARSGPPTARTSPRWPRRGCSGRSSG